MIETLDDVSQEKKRYSKWFSFMQKPKLKPKNLKFLLQLHRKSFPSFISPRLKQIIRRCHYGYFYPGIKEV